MDHDSTAALLKEHGAGSGAKLAKKRKKPKRPAAKKGRCASGGKRGQPKKAASRRSIGSAESAKAESAESAAAAAAIAASAPPGRFVLLVAHGSYNPPHRWHIEMLIRAREFLEQEGVDPGAISACIGTTRNSYVQNKREGQAMDEEWRLELLGKLIDDMRCSEWIVAVSGSTSTNVKDFAKKQAPKKHETAAVIGSDVWYRYGHQYLKDMSRVFVVPRAASLLVIITGSSCSGKTSLANELKQRLQSIEVTSCIVSQDRFRKKRAGVTAYCKERGKCLTSWESPDLTDWSKLDKAVASKHGTVDVVIVEGYLLFYNMSEESKLRNFDCCFYAESTVEQIKKRRKTRPRDWPSVGAYVDSAIVPCHAGYESTIAFGDERIVKLDSAGSLKDRAEHSFELIQAKLHDERRGSSVPCRSGELPRNVVFFEMDAQGAEFSSTKARTALKAGDGEELRRLCGASVAECLLEMEFNDVYRIKEAKKKQKKKRRCSSSSATAATPPSKKRARKAHCGGHNGKWGCHKPIQANEERYFYTYTINGKERRGYLHPDCVKKTVPQRDRSRCKLDDRS